MTVRIKPKISVVSKRFAYPTAQRGATLLIGVIFLIVLMLLGISAATISTLDERMARNLRDKNIAFQAAEAALSDARQDIAKQRKLSGFYGFPTTAGTCNTAGESGNFKGLCRPAVSGQPVWGTLIEDATKSVEYGEVTGLSADQKFQDAPTPGGVTAQPRYVIEVLPDLHSKDSLKPGGGYGKPSVKVLYRITALGYGSNDGTRVLLQEVIRP